ncbi:MAG: hypothetical protein HYU69_16880 [Bacteroidetes bacterium]|nr:hypothetical protein [Bacteroidota bacterium]
MRLSLFQTSLFLLSAFSSIAQNIEKLGQKGMLKISGGANFSSIVYAAKGIQARRDPFTWFMSGSLNFSVLDWSIPFNYSYSNQHGTFTQPFNQLSLAPQYKWIKGYAGYNSMTFSSYTMAGYVFLGGGIELNPGNWRISAMYGRLNKPVPYDAIADSDANMAYKRMGYGAKAGYEKNGHAMHLILFKASDDPFSIPFIPLNTAVLPKDNMAISLIGKTKLNTHFSLEGEYALSGLTRNILSAEDAATDRKNYFPGLFIMRSTSQFFSAYKTAFAYHAQQFNIQLQYERVAPDYQTLGAYYFNNDLENITLAPSLSLLKGKLNLSLNSGFQRNNLDKTKLNDTRRFVNAANVNMMVSNKLSLNGSYSNFSSYTKNRPQNDPFFYNTLDTLNFYQVTQSANTGVNYNFGNAKLKQGFMLFTSYQVTGQRTGMQEQVPFIVYSGNLGYNLSWLPTKTNGSITFNINQSVLDVLTTTYWGPNLSVAQTFMNSALRISTTGTFNQVVINGKTNSNVFNSRVGINYVPQIKEPKYGKPTLGITCNYLKRLPSEQSVKKFNELTATINLSYSF